MQRTNTLPELLAPAGSYEALLGAIEAGADAVYLGGKSFNARAYAKNLDDEDVKRAITYAHLHNVKVYVTLNTLLFDKELSSFLEYAKYLYEIGADAVIVADMGAISLLRRELPFLEIHASTQATVQSSAGADELYAMGVRRVVLSRELSLENIKKTTEICKGETEIFLHGALCVCHSGQCLFSSLVGDRSGNRGECAQPCRLPYKNGYPLSLKDLSLCSHIPELIESGVSSLKIEGRMKSPEYVYGVTKIYRRLLDERRNATKEEKEALASLFSRGGFTDGYFVGKLGPEMEGVRSETDKEKTRSLEQRSFKERKLKISAVCKIKTGCPALLELSYKDKKAVFEGEIPETAKSFALTEEGVISQISKMGNTFFTLEKDDVSLYLDDGLNLPVSALNSLRRGASQALLEQFNKKAEKNPPQQQVIEKITAKSPDAYTALCFNYSQFEAISDENFFDIIYLPLLEISDTKKIPNGVYIPPVITESETDEVLSLMKKVKSLGVKYALVGNLSHISLAREAGLIPNGDFRLNVANNEAQKAWRSLGVERFVLSPELTLAKIRDIHDGSPIVYGRIPLMLLERCYMKINFGCRTCSKCHLTDRRGVKFPLIREYKHRNLLLNSSITYMGDKKELLSQYGIRGGHFIFTVETPDECIRAISAYKSGRALQNTQIRRISK